MQELLLDYNLYEDNYIKTIILNYYSDISNGIINSSMDYAISRAASSLRKNYFLIDPLEQTRKICNLSSNLDNLPNFIE